MSESQHALDNKLLLGRYRVMRLLGEGGMGTVHLARVEGAEGFTRPVVVKRMKRDVRASEEGNRLFIREAKILSKLQHPGIVGIIDFGVEDGAHIMVLEYVHGYTLAPWLEYRRRSQLPLPVDVCLCIVRRILDALHYAHHFGTEGGQEIEIVHRDVSPDNVLLSNRGYVHLLDFGIASMRGPQGEGSTKSGAFRGKLCYAGPETVKGEPATPRSDQYSAAVVLLELLTGVTPFEADSIAETFSKMLHEVPAPASKFRDDIPDGLDGALARALQKEPELRFESALSFSRELRRFQEKDDEDIAQQLRELVQKEFELLPAAVGVEGLKAREQALEKILSVYPESIEAEALNLPNTIMDASFAPDGAGRDTTEAAVSSTRAPEQKQLRGLLWGLLVVGGLIAVGLGAAVALLSRTGSGPEQVVVVGGNNEQEDSAQPLSSVEPEATASVGSVRVSPVATGGSGTSTQAEADGPGQPNVQATSQSGSAAKTDGTTRQAKLSSAVQQKSGAFQSCFAKHLDDQAAAPEAVLHFSVAEQGGGAQVNVEPKSLAITPLGACLKGAASDVQFPRLEEPVAFRVPVRARVSRTKGSP